MNLLYSIGGGNNSLRRAQYTVRGIKTLTENANGRLIRHRLTAVPYLDHEVPVQTLALGGRQGYIND